MAYYGLDLQRFPQAVRQSILNRFCPFGESGDAVPEAGSWGMPGLDIETRTDGDCAIVALSGHLDADTAHQFRDALRELTTARARTVIVDNTKLDYLSSQGVTTLVEYAMELRKGGGDLVLCAVSGSPLIVLEHLSLDRYFRIFDTFDEARTAMVRDA